MTTERAYKSDAEAYEVFVGGITPEQFVAGFDSTESAVTDFMENFEDPDGEDAPSWLESALLSYLEIKLAEF
jgi:hypothetical protein